MDDALVWKEFFRQWPSDVERRGVLVTTFGEQIPFDGFVTSETLLLVERRIPDTSGARKLILPYRNIAAVKLTEVVKNKSFQPLGFEETRAKHQER